MKKSKKFTITVSDILDLVPAAFLFVFVIYTTINVISWKSNHEYTLDNVYIKTETVPVMYNVSVNDITKEKSGNISYSFTFVPENRSLFVNNAFTRTFTESEYKSILGETCTRLETTAHKLMINIPSKGVNETYTVSVLRTSEFGEHAFTDAEIKEIVNCVLERFKESDTFLKRIFICDQPLLQHETNICRTMDYVKLDALGFCTSLHEHWQTLREEGYKRLGE